MNDLIMQFFDAKSYLEDKNIPYTQERSEWINISCIFCGDTGQHLGISDDNRCHCWKCGGHNIGKLVQLIEDCDWAGAMAMMEQYQNYTKLSLLEQPAYVPPKQTVMPKEFGKGIQERMTLLPMKDYYLVYHFLLKRGFEWATIPTLPSHDLYYSPGPLGEYKFRLGIPIYIRKQLVTFMTRDVTGKAKVPYISQPIKEAVVPCKNTLYGYDDVIPGGNIIIVEGIIDQWKIKRNCLATYGTGWTIEQVALLRSLHPNKVFILYDSEEVAQEAAKKLSQAIWFCSTEVIYLDDKKDPGELTIEEGKQVAKELLGDE